MMNYAKLGYASNEVKTYTAEDIKMKTVQECDACDKRIEISGKLLDTDGEPIPFAHLVNKTKNTGSTTDSNGIYSFQADATDDIEVSSLGFKKMQVKASELLKGLTLQTDVINLPTVVVTARKKHCNFSCWVKRHQSHILIGLALATMGLSMYGIAKNRKENQLKNKKDAREI